MEKKTAVELRFSLRSLRNGLAVLLLLVVAAELASETLTMTTYYPSPLGIYRKIVTTGDTVLSRDSGKVGVGTAAPTAKLDVRGLIRTGNFPTTDEPALGGVNGAVYYDDTSHKFRGFVNGAWTDLGGAGVGGGIPAGMAAFNSPGAFDWTVPSGVTRIMVEVWGGGGGGGAGVMFGGGVAGGLGGAGGGGGGYGKGIFTVAPGAVFSVNIGAGGTAWAAGPGGASSFGSLLSAGGGSAGASSGGIGSAGGESTAPVNIGGGRGGGGSIINTGATSGGGAGMGGAGGNGGPGGANGSHTEPNGHPGTAPGGGGGGGAVLSYSYGTGGFGAPGRVVISW